MSTFSCCCRRVSIETLGSKRIFRATTAETIFFSLALRGECDIVDGNVSAFLAPHRCLDCHREGFARVGESDVDLKIRKLEKNNYLKTNVYPFPNILVNAIWRPGLPEVVLLSIIGDLPDGKLPVGHLVCCPTRLSLSLTTTRLSFIIT